MKNNGQPQQIPTMPPQPAPMIITMAAARFEGNDYVQLNIATPIGLQIYFIPTENAEQLGAQMITAAKQRSGLVVPQVDISGLKLEK